MALLSPFLVLLANIYYNLYIAAADIKRLYAPQGRRKSMYKVSLPIIIMNPRFETYYEDYIEKCKMAGVDRVFLCSSTWTAPESVKQRNIELLNKYIPVFKEHGFEVGIWFNSLGHGGTCGDFVNEDISDGLTRMVGLDGKTNMGAYCPLCENLQALATDWIRRLGQTDVSMIMMDDDYRYAFRGDILCACEKHQKLFTKELGEPFDAEKMKAALTSGGPNRWRDTWLRVQGKSLNDFAQMLRDALDEVNPDMRLSICSVLSTWDIDGVDSITLAKTFAGKTKPFLRLIGAPYWHALRNFQEARLGTICEYERLQQHWCKDSGIEIFCEGDSYPRPTYQVPASYLEGLDQVMRAAGTSDGILKYMLDYTSSPDFETGYIEHHMEDEPLFEVLQKVMGEKQAVGVTVYEPMKTFALSHKPGEVLENRCIPASIRLATDVSLPIRYDAGDDATFIFGDAAEVADSEQMQHGAILDMTAAQILTRRGFDVGLKCVKGTFSPNEEAFTAEKEVVGVVGGCWYEAELKDNAFVDSWQVYREDGKEPVKCPAVYTYENTEGQRFMVYCFHAQEGFELVHCRGLFRSKPRAQQIRRILPWLSGKKLDAVCEGAPDLYMMAKRDQDSLSVTLWNFGVDRILHPTVHLAEEWSELICEWGNVKMEGHTVTAERMPAFSCVCFTVKK